MTGSVTNLFLVYQFIKRLVQPFDEWDAFKFGIIDKNGNILKKAKDRISIEQRDSFRAFDIMILKLKKLLAKLPFGKTKLASFAAALWLVKESENEKAGILLTEDVDTSFLNFFEENKDRLCHDFKLILDEESLTPKQMKKREEIVKRMKKKKAEFVAKYGEKDAESVMFATATKLAKEVKESTPPTNVTGGIAIVKKAIKFRKKKKEVDEAKQNNIMIRQKLLDKIMKPIKQKEAFKKSLNKNTKNNK